MNAFRPLFFLCLLLATACARSPKKSSDPWTQWYQMQLPVRLASARVSTTAARAFDRFQAQVERRNYAQALAILQDPGLDAQAKPWAQVLTGQFAGLHTRTCEGGQWLYFGDPKRKQTPRLSMLELLDALDPLRAAQDKTLANQAKAASVRVMVIARDCPGARSVQDKASAELPQILGELAEAQGSALAPDLAYLQATLRLEQEQWSQAQHWLKVAKDQGLDDPRITLARAQALYGQKAFDQALHASLRGAKAIPDELTQPAADAWTLAARSAWALGKTSQASQYLKEALERDPAHPSAWALRVLMLSEQGDACQSELPAQLEPLWNISWAPAPTLLWLLDDMSALLDAEHPAALPCLSQALQWNIDQESDAALRGIRYFYAATLYLRLGNYESAFGRALMARAEFESADSPLPPLPVEDLINTLIDTLRVPDV